MPRPYFRNEILIQLMGSNVPRQHFIRSAKQFFERDEKPGELAATTENKSIAVRPDKRD